MTKLVESFYPARTVLAGLWQGNPFVGFVLASKKSPFRRMDPHNSKPDIHVFPREGHEQDSIDDPDLDNYAAIIPTHLYQRKGNPRPVTAIVGFNGHMCKRTVANLNDGMDPLLALDLVLLDFRGATNDARVGVIAYHHHANNETNFFFGTSDNDRTEKWIKKVDVLDPNSGQWLSVKFNHGPRPFSIPSTVSTPELLANFVTTKHMFGKDPIWCLCSGVIILNKKVGNLILATHNTPNKTINNWIKQQKAES